MFQNKGTGNRYPIESVLPTALYLSGVPVPTDMDAEVMLDLIDTCYLNANPVQYQEPMVMPPVNAPSSTIEEGEEDIKKKLRDLGYI